MRHGRGKFTLSDGEKITENSQTKFPADEGKGVAV
jgi:hypothetical protein